MIKFEDLKIGDRLKNVFSGLIFEVIAVGPDDILLGGANMPTRHESILSWVPSNWLYYCPQCNGKGTQTVLEREE